MKNIGVDQMKNFIIGDGALLLTSFIWGTAFVAQITGMDLIGPFTFSASRCFLSSIFVIFLILFQTMRRGEKREKEEIKTEKRDLIISGIACGVLLFLGSSFQQVGLQYTTAGKTSFITSLYIIIVPLMGMFFKKKVNLFTWIAVFLGTIGLYLLALSELRGGGVINKGDLIVFIGSFFWAAHILVIDRFAKRVDPIKLSAFQFVVTTLLAAIVAIAIEKPELSNIFMSWKSIAYAGILSGGVAYTLQMIGQKHTTNPTLATLILSLESVFGALAGYLILNEQLTRDQTFGCVIMFIAIIIAQTPEDLFKKRVESKK